MAPAAAEPEEGSHGTFRARCTMYGLLAAFEMTNYVTRLAIPYIVTFMVRDFSFSEQQRALLLNSFTPGYILTQIPAGWAIQRWGAKPVVSVNSLGIEAIMLSLPTVAARRGGPDGHGKDCGGLGADGGGHGHGRSSEGSSTYSC